MKLPRSHPAHAPLFTVVLLGMGVLASQGGCGSGGQATLGEAGTYDADPPGAFLGGDASAGALDARIEQNHVAVTFVTLSCEGDCATVNAVATGGHPPYTFVWDDGSTDATRHVCPTSSAHYSVRVTDAGISGELARPPETVQLALTANVLACPDGGISDAGAGVCLANPSFEGTAATSGFDAPPWVACGGPLFGQARIWSESTSGPGQTTPSPVPTEGSTYLFLAPNQGLGPQNVSEPLCATLHAGTTYRLLLDLQAAFESPDASLERAARLGDLGCQHVVLGGTALVVFPTPGRSREVDDVLRNPDPDAGDDVPHSDALRGVGGRDRGRRTPRRSPRAGDSLPAVGRA